MRYIRVDGVVDGRPSEHDDRFLVEFDVDAPHKPRMDNGVIIDPSLVTTERHTEALRFETVEDAHAYWTRTSTTVPVRPDGKPNRPFTAYTVSILDPETDPEFNPDRQWRQPIISYPFDPPTKEEYERLVAERSEVIGEGATTGQRVPCPFCAAPRWKEWRLFDMAAGDYSGMTDVSTCSNCGRSARFLIDVSGGETKSDLIQTGGVDPPSYLHAPRREDVIDHRIVDGTRREAAHGR